MSISCQKVARPLTRCIRQSQTIGSLQLNRNFSITSRNYEEISLQTENPTAPVFDPLTTTSRKGERALLKSGIKPIGSRRRRAAIRTSDNIPFEQLPYQCFQEARKILQADREQKLKAIATERGRIARLTELDASQVKGGEVQKQTRLDSMRRHLEHLKILADINDPLIKKRFEDDEGDMNKPIYRYLADRKWRSYRRLIITQRITQLSLVPDILPHFSPTADVRLAFRTHNVQPGDFVDSRVSEIPAKLKVQVFDQGERLVTIVVVDSDVPDMESDNFKSRCHYLATNIPISPTQTSLPLSQASHDTQLILPWLPPYAQKGSPYHRLSIFILEQPDRSSPLDISLLKERFPEEARDGFSLRNFKDTFEMKPIGLGVFRSQWDEGTKGVMERAGVEGADVEWKRKKVVAIKPKQKARGWEARHSGPKYLSLKR